MYRVYELTDKEKNKITKLRWDGDTFYYDVFETQEECDEEEKRLARINEEYEKKMENYLKVRTIIAINRGLKWKIDGKLYEHEMYIPEIVRDKTIDFYGLQNGVMIIRTKEGH